jgi:ribosome-associated protein
MSSTQSKASQEAIEAATTAARAIAYNNGEDVVMLDLAPLLVVTDVFVIASGTSRRHVNTLVDEAESALREIGRKPIRREGTDHGQWVLLDYGDVVVHVFDKETRAYYDLARLWADASHIDVVPSSSEASV